MNWKIGGFHSVKLDFGDLIDRESLKIEELFVKVGQLDRLSWCMELAAGITDAELWDITNGHEFLQVFEWHIYIS